jgi:23S rRNA (guanine745-N1)-methyltransferase
MLADVLAYLRCPICGTGLAPAAAALRCPNGHSFDRARQGYVDLTAGPARHGGDSADMVADRAGFLTAGHYGFISAGLAAAAPDQGLVVDVGAGTGAHLTAVLDARPGTLGLALDVSRYALRRAARAHPRAAAARCDVWSALPLADHSAAMLLNVFAPRNGAEFARVLRPDGTLVVVTPGPDHLGELVGALGLLRVDPAKQDRLAASLGARFTPRSSTVLERALRLDHGEVATLVGMGPSAWHADPGELAGRIGALGPPVEATAQVRLSVYSTDD